MLWVSVVGVIVFALAAIVVLRGSRSLRCPICGGLLKVVGHRTVPVEGWLKAFVMPIRRWRSCNHTVYPPSSIKRPTIE